MWIHWNKATNLFHAEEVSRILSFPAPRLNDLVRIDMKDYALCYQFPSSPTGFQNFSMWPLFNCLSIPNIVGVIEAAVSATRRIIFVSHYPAMLTVATETIRHCIRVYEWSGLYVPVVHARHAKELVQEPGPYMLGITAECRTLFSAPSDALVIDLDRNYVMTSAPPAVFSAGQRAKMISRLTNALKGDVAPAGVPLHLRSAYGGGKLIPAGQIIVMRGEVESVENPPWWDHDGVMSVMDHVCEKLGRNTGMKAIFGNSVKKPLMTKVSMRHLNEIVRERNQYSRDAMEAWQDFINLKGRMDGELSKVTKRNNFLVDELESWKQQVKLVKVSVTSYILTASIVSQIPSLCGAAHQRDAGPQSQDRDTQTRKSPPHIAHRATKRRRCPSHCPSLRHRKATGRRPRSARPPARDCRGARARTQTQQERALSTAAYQRNHQPPARRISPRGASPPKPHRWTNSSHGAYRALP